MGRYQSQVAASSGVDALASVAIARQWNRPPVGLPFAAPRRTQAPMSDPFISLLLTSAEVAGTMAFALSGLLEAARKRLDAVGVCVVSGLAAFGGGTLRDVLLDRRPFFWVENSLWLWVLPPMCIAAMLFMHGRHLQPTERAMQWPDALGLGLFGAAGTQIALAQSQPAIVAVLMGVVTATFGGVLRDIVCNEIPTAFRDHRPYAVCALAGGCVLVAAQSADVPDSWALVTAASVGTLLRVLALATNYRLPGWSAGRRPRQ
jgi:uncharacterized membrane protein YeiH